MKLFKSKRAVTPIVATVFLIVFALGLGVAVMSVGGDYLTPENIGLNESISKIDLSKVVDSCKVTGAISEEEYEALKEKIS